MYNDGGLVFDMLEQRKRDLLREAKMERLAMKAQAKTPSEIQRGWMRLIKDLIQSSTTRVRRQVALDDGSVRIDSQDQGLELG